MRGLHCGYICRVYQCDWMHGLPDWYAHVITRASYPVRFFSLVVMLLQFDTYTQARILARPAQVVRIVLLAVRIPSLRKEPSNRARPVLLVCMSRRIE